MLEANLFQTYNNNYQDPQSLSSVYVKFKTVLFHLLYISEINGQIKYITSSHGNCFDMRIYSLACKKKVQAR